MATGIEEFAEIFSSLVGRIWTGDADAIEAEGLRFPGERVLEIDR